MKAYSEFPLPFWWLEFGFAIPDSLLLILNFPHEAPQSALSASRLLKDWLYRVLICGSMRAGASPLYPQQLDSFWCINDAAMSVKWTMDVCNWVKSRTYHQERPFAVLHRGQSWGRKHRVRERDAIDSSVFLLHLTVSDTHPAWLPFVRTNFLKTNFIFTETIK